MVQYISEISEKYYYDVPYVYAVVRDARINDKGNPNMVIYGSHNSKYSIHREEIAEKNIEYTKDFLVPAEHELKRTIPSIVGEWRCHDIAYSIMDLLGFFRSHTKNVDLDNADENTYTWCR